MHITPPLEDDDDDDDDVDPPLLLEEDDEDDVDPPLELVLDDEDDDGFPLLDPPPLLLLVDEPLGCVGFELVMSFPLLPLHAARTVSVAIAATLEAKKKKRMMSPPKKPEV